GTHRLVSPEATFAANRRSMGVTGITRIANVTGLDRIGIPVAFAIRPNSRSLAVAQGKGSDLAAAKASALMEAIESHHAERIEAPLKLGSAAQLGRTHHLVDVDRLARAPHSRFHHDLPLLWIEGVDLLNERSVWVPYECVHTDWTVPQPPGSGCFPADSTGLASGNHLLEAIGHAISEAVERDATARRHDGAPGAEFGVRIDLDTVDDPVCRSALDVYDQAGVAVGAWDITTGLGIPAFWCTVVDRADDGLAPLYAAAGSGCHPSRAIALLRALTEAAQSRLTAIAGSRDDLFRDDYDRIAHPAMVRHQRRRLEADGSFCSFAAVSSFESATFNDDIEWLLGRLRAAGIEQVVAVDLSLPAFPAAVVRIVIPGLRIDHEH
ncbi:MAG TPA: YcaO-like family protein, partial [Thermomicrobiales bacterium]|nr:YcaO-like family protein [Thermomicrobiales bacterium]